MKINTLKPYRIFAEWLEFNALKQFEDALNQPYSIAGALMPDAHFGYGLPIGAVMSTSDVIVPSWVGYDIGCGVCALPTTFDANEILGRQHELHVALYNGLIAQWKPSRFDGELNVTQVTQDIIERLSGHDFGSLGGGNHFLELGIDENDKVWFIVHSGSRRVGGAIASHYMAKAANADEPKEGSYGVPLHSAIGQDYLLDMNFALNYAMENRTHIIKTVLATLVTLGFTGKAKWSELINRNHNHAEQVHGMIIHRKGATHAEDGLMGVVPGDSEKGVFIVRGKGNPESLWSSSHGAGRIMARADAKEKGIDETPAVYKDIFEVMKQQAELVDIVHHISPLLTVKQGFTPK